jgi:toxin YoeB
LSKKRSNVQPFISTGSPGKNVNLKITRELVFQPEFLEDMKYWVSKDRKIALKVFEIIEAAKRDPFQGIGKPEPLKHLGPGVWSRRLTLEHRIVYLVTVNKIDFLQARFHYGDD